VSSLSPPLSLSHRPQGAFDSIGQFIRQDLSTNETDTLIGVLQSAFPRPQHPRYPLPPHPPPPPFPPPPPRSGTYIVGYAVASVSFGHLVHSYPPFKLMAGGLLVWVVAVVLSGAAPHFWVLVLARMLSGVGEASFQTIVPPFIDDNAPPSKRGLWLSIFFMAIPVGTAAGYAWGGNIAATLNWRWAFFIEAIPMLPLATLIWFMPYNKNRREALAKLTTTTEAGGVAEKEEEGEGEGLDASAVDYSGAGGNSTLSFSPHPTQRGGGGAAARDPSDSAIGRELEAEFQDDSAALNDTVSGATKPSFWHELRHVLTSPLYVVVILGYAGYTATLAGIGSFGPELTKGLGLFPDQASASLYFGGAVSLAGAVGTPLGGWLLDRATRKRRVAKRRAEVNADREVAGLAPLTEADAEPELPPEDPDDVSIVDVKLNIALPQATWLVLVGSAFCMGGIMLGAGNAPAFFGLLSIGALSLCATTAGINLAIMASVRPESRSFAIGIGTLLIHALGDVPAPTVIGALADNLAPQTCIVDPSTGVASCTQDAYGLQVTLTICLAWLVWPIALWAVGSWIAATRGAGWNRPGGGYGHVLADGGGGGIDDDEEEAWRGGVGPGAAGGSGGSAGESLLAADFVGGSSRGGASKRGGSKGAAASGASLTDTDDLRFSPARDWDGRVLGGGAGAIEGVGSRSPGRGGLGKSVGTGAGAGTGAGSGRMQVELRER
jgi:MFS transporter, Spinster family, sphingosine-1-phosphate transporter